MLFVSGPGHFFFAIFFGTPTVSSSVFLALAAFGAAVLALAVALWRLSLRRPLRGEPAGDTMERAYHAPGET